MTLSDIIAEVDQLRPNQYDKDIKTGWINEIESKAVKDVINRAKGNDVVFTPYDYDTHSETTLKIPDIHKDVYVYYLFSKIDYTQNEIERYNADMTMEDGAWKEYAMEYRREHEPK